MNQTLKRWIAATGAIAVLLTGTAGAYADDISGAGATFPYPVYSK